jgi:hypothetical protein
VWNKVKGTVSRNFTLQVFFLESSFLKPLKIKLESFRQFAEIFTSQGAPPCSINDTCGKFAAGVNYTNFATARAGVVDNHFSGSSNKIRKSGKWSEQR